MANAGPLLESHPLYGGVSALSSHPEPKAIGTRG
jgi:hypothetical protein